ncbi:zinc finger protein 3-like [Lepus europaeus]|uniref:zinc finger protein 3-like n=1 Tax=Lepus europaeus TaxID=9983 RepID=UPI002B4760D7|nr:zinc finger protein 3-like [Lepus europaeus]XP_062034499.1 zinc finger protein 3-like [Lepus europaeus]
MSVLIDHQEFHTGKKQYSCNECGKAFLWKSLLTMHQRIHTREKPYGCNECGMTLCWKTLLTKHLTVHPGEIRYECNGCRKPFFMKSDLVRHERIPTKKKHDYRLTTYKSGLVNYKFLDPPVDGQNMFGHGNWVMMEKNIPELTVVAYMCIRDNMHVSETSRAVAEPLFIRMYWEQQCLMGGDPLLGVGAYLLNKWVVVSSQHSPTTVALQKCPKASGRQVYQGTSPAPHTACPRS